MIYIKNIPFTFISFRIVDGFTGGNISVAQTVIADITNKEERTKVFGMIVMLSVLVLL